jgi:tRNA threonylcarbamoyladenosine biosynthesis protein TsaB
MLILALDTSGDICSLALTDDARELTSIQFRHERRLSERLSPLIEFTLRDYGITIRDITALAVGLGPGSFTGVRVGVTMAKTLAFALELPLVGVSSLDALVEPLRAVGPFTLPIAAVTSTRRTESVVAFYDAGKGTPIAPPSVLLSAEVRSRAAEIFGRVPLLILGENAATVYEATEDKDGVRALVAAPTALSVARLALHRLSQGETDDVDTLIPLYVTPTPVG